MFVGSAVSLSGFLEALDDVSRKTHSQEDRVVGGGGEGGGGYFARLRLFPGRP